MQNDMQETSGEEQNTPTTADAAEGDDFTPRYLDAAELTFTRAEVGTARLEIRGEVCHLRVVVRRLMPLSRPEAYISQRTRILKSASL